MSQFAIILFNWSTSVHDNSNYVDILSPDSPRGRDVKLPELFQSSKRCFSWVVFGGMYLCDYLLDSPKIGTYLIIFCLTQMKIMFKHFRETVWGV